MGRREENREQLRERLIATTERRIEAQGLGDLTARGVTAEARVALGSIYTAFESLDLLILHVNARTLARLQSHLARELEGAGDPAGRLVALARGYAGFALRNRRLWAALFDHRLPEGVDLPDWHGRELARLMAMIEEPLAALRPDLSEAQRALRARTLFAAVHGVVHLSLAGPFVAAPVEALEGEVVALVEALVRGLPEAAGA
jgi:AcrR family transcriptional regulator